jgi:hypothetical protein
MESSAGFQLTSATRFLIEPQRLVLAAEFVQAMSDNTARHTRFGVLLSGPAGAGKTAVGLLSFSYCVARSLACVYIPDAGEWVGAAQAGRGDEFFLQVLLRQNADLILAHPTLRAALAPAFAGAPLDATVMNRLLMALRARPGPAVGCILDEVQKITAAIAAGLIPGCSLERQRAADYFQQWHNWVNRCQVFVRMDIASAHGSRELTLPGGEEGRLRILRPWSAAEFTVLCSAAASPLFIADPVTRARALVTCGGILRLAYKVVQGLISTVPMETISHEIRHLQLECCQRWFGKLSDAERRTASCAMLALVRGEVRWDRVKGLYDDGIVARVAASTFVEPVSPVAASVIFEVLTADGREQCPLLLSFDDGELRGAELERQLLLFLALANRTLRATRLDAADCPSVVARADAALPLSNVATDLRMHEAPMLFIPLSKQFACDQSQCQLLPALRWPPLSCGSAALLTPEILSASKRYCRGLLRAASFMRSELPFPTVPLSVRCAGMASLLQAARLLTRD